MNSIENFLYIYLKIIRNSNTTESYLIIYHIFCCQIHAVPTYYKPCFISITISESTKKYVLSFSMLFPLMMQHSVFLRRSSIKKRNLLTSVILDCRIVCLHPLKYLMFVEKKCNDKKSSSFDWHMLTDIL